jgi:hypothetical protein
VEVRLKPVSNEGPFTLEAETVHSAYHPSHCSGETEICHMAVTAHALQAVHVRFMLLNNDGHFTLEAEILFCPYHPSHCSGETKFCSMALPAHAL